VVFDNVGGDLSETAFALLAEGGRFSAHGTPGRRFAQIDPDAAADAASRSGDPGQLRRTSGAAGERALAAAADGSLRR
jgi:NADPH2:quinone reductase